MKPVGRFNRAGSAASGKCGWHRNNNETTRHVRARQGQPRFG